MIDLLEPRMLFTTVAVAEAALTADVTTLHGDLTVVTAAAKSDLSAITADLKALPKTAANKSMIKHTLGAEAGVIKLLTGGTKKIYAAEAGKLKQVVADGLAVLVHPNSAAAKKKLAAILSTAVASVNAPLTSLGTTAEPAITKVAGDLEGLVLANPTDTQLSTDIFNDGTVVTTDLTKLSADAQTFQTDLSTLISVL